MTYVSHMEKTTRPSSLSRTLALVPPAIALVAQQASGAYDVFLKMDNITGEVTSPKDYVGYIKLDSFSWSLERPVTLLSGGSSRVPATPSISELTLSKKVDKTSAPIFLNAVGSSAIPTVTLDMVDTTTNAIFYRIILSDVLVSRQEHGGTPGSDKPSESISLNFTKIKIETFDSNGKITTGPAGWDLTKNSKL